MRSIVSRFGGRVREALADWATRMMGVGWVSRSINLPDLCRPAESLIWIYLGMQARAEAISHVPIRVSDGRDEVVTDGPLVDLLAAPNSWMDGVQYLALIESYLALFNRAFVLIVEDGGRVSELVPLNPKHCTPIYATHVPSGVRAWMGIDYADPTTGERRRFDRDRLIPIISYSPYDLTTSIAIDEPGRRAMQVDVLAQEQNLAIFKNGGMPDVVFESDQKWTKPQVEEFLTVWQDRYGGAANAHKPGVLYGGLKAKGLGLSPKDLEFFEGRRFSRSEQIALMRVKPAMVGLMEGETGLSQGSSTQEQYASWWTSTGLGELARIASAHQRFLVERRAWASGRTRTMTRGERESRTAHLSRPGRGARESANTAGLTLWFDEGAIDALQRARFALVDSMVKVCGLGWEPDAANDYLGLRLPPHPTNVATIPFSVQPARVLAEPESTAVDAGGAPVSTGTEAVADTALNGAQIASLISILQQYASGLFTAQSAIATIGASFPTLPAETIRRIVEGVRVGVTPADAVRGRESRLDGMLAELGRTLDAGSHREGCRASAQAAALRRRLDGVIAPLERQAAKRWSRYFIEQRGRVLERLQAGGRESGRVREVSASDLLPGREETMSLRMRIGPLLREHMQAGAASLADETGLAPDRLAIDKDPRFEKAIERRLAQADEVNETTRSKIADVLRDGYGAGDTPGQLADRIADYYNRNCVGEESHRPMTAARTETAGIVNEGRMMAAQQVPGLRKGWLHGSPEKPRDAHVAAQDRYLASPIPVNEAFVVNGHECMQPGDVSLPVEEVANCTCMVVFSAAKES